MTKNNIRINRDSVEFMQLKILNDAWKKDISKFARDIFDFYPTPQQSDLFDAVVNFDRVSCKSGHGTGKSTSAAIIIFWFLTVFKNPQIPATSPTKDQLRDVLWARLWELYAVMNPIFKSRLQMTATRVQNVFSEESFCTARTGRKGNPDALQGFHADNLLIIGDEAPGIDDIVFKPIQGALTGKNNKIVLIGNPVRKTGYFFNTFKPSSGWKNITLNAEESPIVSRQSVEQWAIDSGKDSDDYRVRVLGEFPKQEWNSLFSEDDVDYAMYSSNAPQGDPVVWGLDVARFGNDESVLAVRYGNAVTEIESYSNQNRDTAYMTDRVLARWRMTPDNHKPVAIFIDVIGVGGPIYDRLLNIGLPCYSIIANQTARDDIRFANKKAEMYVNFHELLAGRTINLPPDDQLREELLSIKYQYQGNRYLIQSKKVSKVEYGKSPDRAESVIFTYAEPVLEEAALYGDIIQEYY